jgi:hypothetical protein
VVVVVCGTAGGTVGGMTVLVVDVELDVDVELVVVAGTVLVVDVLVVVVLPMDVLPMDVLVVVVLLVELLGVDATVVDVMLPRLVVGADVSFEPQAAPASAEEPTATSHTNRRTVIIIRVCRAASRSVVDGATERDAAACWLVSLRCCWFAWGDWYARRLLLRAAPRRLRGRWGRARFHRPL